MSLRYISRTLVKAVQWGADQNPKGIIKPSQPRLKSESDDSAQFRWVYAASESAKMISRNGKSIPRDREAEKIENAMHLMFWGPK